MKDSSQVYVSLLGKYLTSQWRKVVAVGLFVIASQALLLLSPQIARSFIDQALAGESVAVLVQLALIFIGIAMGTQILVVGTTYVSEIIAWTATNALREDITQHCLGLDMSFHNTQTPGGMIERIDGDVTVLGNFFSQFCVRMLSSGLLLVGMLALLFREDWRVGLIFMLFALLTLMLLNRIRSVAIPHWGEARQASMLLYGFIEERIVGATDVRPNGGTGYVMSRLSALIRTHLQRERKAAVIGGLTWTATVACFSLANALALGLGAYLFHAGAFTVGTVYLTYYYVQMLRNPVEQISRQFQDLQRAGASIKRIEELLRTESRVKDGPGVDLPAQALAIEFDRVSFWYGQNSPVLFDMSFRLAPGRVMGLLGRTGSGKTTIARLLFRLYDPAEGTVRLGGVDVRQAKLGHLRRRIAMVTQDVHLFHATLRDNLTLFNPSIPDQQLLRSLRDLGVWDWFQSLPAGLDSVIGRGGSELSAGEAQLVAFVRVFLHDPGVVILDEPSSRLDAATERILWTAIERLFQNRTAIVIAHRLTTVERVDDIMLMEDGRIAEFGPRAVLCNDPTSRFHQLLTSREGWEA